MNFIRLLLLLNFILLGCVSIDIPKNELRRSTQYSFKSPTSSLFESKDDSNLDKLWIHKSNGNSISILSDCTAGYDPSLEQIKNGITSGIQDLKTKSTVYQKYNNRKALFTHILGEVDGVKSEFDLVIFKKNGCVYTITHVATQKSYAETKKTFDEFIQNFKVN